MVGRTDLLTDHVGLARMARHVGHPGRMDRFTGRTGDTGRSTGRSTVGRRWQWLIRRRRRQPRRYR